MINRKKLLVWNNTAALSINSQSILALKQNYSDLQTTNYQLLHDNLYAIKNQNPDCRFVYLMGYKDSHVILLVDAENPFSADFSPPGQIYSEATSEVEEIFSNGNSFVEGPVQDRWGTWISALTPIFDERGKVVAVLGADIDVRDWASNKHLLMIIFVLTVFLSVGLVMVFEYRKHQTVCLQAISNNLSDTEKKYQEVFENAIEGIFRTTPEGKYQIVNPSFAHMLGYDSPEELIESVTDIGEQLYANKKDRLEFIDILYKKECVKNYEIKLVRKDGQVMWMRVNARKVDDQGQSFLEGSVMDISEEKRIKESEEKIKKVLVQSDKLDALGRMAGGIAHDFNNILQIISFNAEMILEETSGEVHNYAEYIMSASTRAKNIIKEILFFGRKDSKKDIINIVEIIDNHEKLLKNYCAPTVSVLKDIRHNNLYVAGNKGCIDSIINNLTDNALWAMKDSGGTLSILVEKVNSKSVLKTGRTCSLVDKYVKISISDEGIGIAPEIQDKIFELYFTTKQPNKDDGVGFGLYTVHQLVNSMQGKISFESKVGIGTTFEIYLPLVKKPEAVIPTPIDCIDQKTTSIQKPRIMVVDDEPMIVEIFDIRMKKCGIDVIKFIFPEEALEYYRKNHSRVDMIISDLDMPKINGIKLAEEVSKIKRIPFVIASGYGESALLSKDTNEKIKEVIAKPYDFECITEIIKKYS